MLKKNPQDSDQDDLFRPRLETIIDPRHELARLAMIIDWDGLEADVAQHYCADNGRPGGSARLMAVSDTASVSRPNTISARADCSSPAP